MSSHGYIIVPNWDEFQHYKDRAPAWIKLHLNLLGNDAWLALSTDDRCLLITIWMLVGRYGNGRLKADYGWLMEQAKVGYGPRSRNLERLNDAGFIRFCASPLPKKVASLEVEGSKEPKKEIESARANGARNSGAVERGKKKVVEQAIATVISMHEGDPPDRVEHTIRDLYPGIADQVIAGLPKPATKETPA